MSTKLFRELHRGPTVLVLPNAWDAGSARLIENLGARAIATTSAGLAWSRGYPDGNMLPPDQLIAAVRDIARVIRVPLSVDFEAGYSTDPLAVARLSARLLDAGASGINIEDGPDSPDLLCSKIEAIRQRARETGADLFVNARTDVYLRGIATGEGAVEEILRRATRYRTAGCDGLFVPGLSDRNAITAIATAIDPMPLNVMALPGLPSLEVLQESGARRLSAGSAIAQAALAWSSRLATGFLAGDIGDMFKVSASYGSVNELFADRT